MTSEDVDGVEGRTVKNTEGILYNPHLILLIYAGTDDDGRNSKRKLVVYATLTVAYAWCCTYIQ